MRSSPSFYNRPRLGFHRSLLFFCLSFSLVTAFRPRGVSSSFNLSSNSIQADPLQLRLQRFRKRDLSPGPPSHHVELNSATTAEFAPPRADNSSSVNNSSSHDATNSSHVSSTLAPYSSSPNNTPELKNPSGAVQHGFLNVSKPDSVHEHDPPPASTFPSSLPSASGQLNSSTTPTITPNKTTPSSTSDAFQHPTVAQPSNNPASETRNYSSAHVALNSSLSSNISAKGDSQPNSDGKSIDLPSQHLQKGTVSLVPGPSGDGSKSPNDYTRNDEPSKNLTTSDAIINTHDSPNHTFPSSGAVPVPKDDQNTNHPQTANNQSGNASFGDSLSAPNRAAPSASKSLTPDKKSDSASVKSDKPFTQLADGINNSSGQAAQLNTSDSPSTSRAEAGRVHDVPSHSEPSTNASSLSPSNSARFGVNSTASPNVIGNFVGDANGSSAEALNDLKRNATPAIGQAVAGGMQNPLGSSQNTSSPHPGKKPTIGVVTSNSSADHADGASLNRTLSESNTTAAAFPDPAKTQSGANTSALSGGTDAPLIASPPNASSSDSVGTAAFPNQSADSGGAHNLSGNLTPGASLTNPVAKSDVAAAALAHLDKTRTGANVSASPKQGDGQVDNASLLNATPSALSSATSVHFGNDSAGAPALNLTSNSTNGVFLNSTLANSDAAATALTNLDKTRTGANASAPAHDGDGNTNNVSSQSESSHNISSLSSATSAHFGASAASNLTENPTGGAFRNETLGNNESAGAALVGLQKVNNGGIASTPSSEAPNTFHNLSSSILGSPTNASSLSSTTVAHFGNDSADGDTAYNLTRNHTDGPFINGALAPSHAFAGALTALNKTRSGLAASTPSGEGDSASHKSLSQIGTAKNLSSLSSATSAHFGTDSADGHTAFNLTGNQTDGNPLNSTYSNSEVADAALTDLNKNRTGFITSSALTQGDQTFHKNASHLGSSQNVTSLSSATSAQFGNDSAMGSTAFNLTKNLTDDAFLNGTFANSNVADLALSHMGKAKTGVVSHFPDGQGASIDNGQNLTNFTAFNVTRNSTDGGLPNIGLDAGVATALTGLNKTGTVVNGTIESSLGKLNESDLPVASNSLPNSTLVAHPANATELNTTGISPITILLPGSHTSVRNVSSSTEVPINHHVNATRPNSTQVGQEAPGLHHNATAASVSDTNRSAIAPPSPAPAFVPVSTLFTNPVTPQPAPTSPSPKTTPDTAKHPRPEPPAPFPTTWPRYIVPSNAPTSAPENTTLISILFSNSLNWPWLVTNSNASSQVLVFMPALVSTALHIDASQVVTQSLQAYQPTSFNSQNEGSMLTVWLGYIPSQYVDELQAMLKAPQSAFYKQDNPIYDALGKTVDSSLPITTFSSQARAAQQAAAVSASSNQTQSSGDQGQKMAVIASVTSCGAAILAIGLFLAARQSKQKLKPGGAPFPGSGAGRNLRPLQLSPGSRLQISAPMIGSLSHDAGHSHYYGQAARAQDGQQPRPDLQSFPSFPSLATGMSVMAEDGGHGPMVELPVQYEYGHAHTTSTDLQHATSSRARVDLRSSWWRVHSEDAVNDYETHQHWDSLRVSPSLPPSHGLGRKISSRRSDGSFGMEPHQRPAHRRLQITRGADGLVSGIGRPVMKENSLFF